MWRDLLCIGSNEGLDDYFFTRRYSPGRGCDRCSYGADCVRPAIFAHCRGFRRFLWFINELALLLARLLFCASLTFSTTDDPRPSYDGRLSSINYEQTAPHPAGSAEAPAQNVPKPLIPEKMRGERPQGTYALMGWWLASQNYPDS